MGVLHGGMKCLKYCTFFFNFIVFLAGLLLVGFGGFLFYQIMHYSNPADNTVKVFPISVMVLGFIIFFVGFLGCCGACYENVCMLVTFATIVAILLCLQIAIAVFAYLYKDEMMKLLDNQLEKIFSGQDRTLKDQIQRDLQCCGYKSPDIIIASGPDSCCGDASVCTMINIYKTTCYSAMNTMVNSSMTVIVATAAVLCVLQVAAIIVACCLQSKIKTYAPC